MVTLRKTCWRDAFGADEVVQRVRPHEHFNYLANPHRGTATFQRFNGDPVTPDWTWDDRKGPFSFTAFTGDPKGLVNDRYPHTTLAYCRWGWADLEPQKGKIRWEVFDGTLAAARARGQTVQLRLQPVLGAAGVPAWYWATGAAVDPVNGGVDRDLPDHNDPRYLEHWGDVIRALGARYDGHPDVESFDVAYGGPCGETGGNCTPETTRALVDLYCESFPRTPLISMIATEGCRYAATRHDRVLGWRADCYGDIHEEGHGQVPDRLCWNHMYDCYPMEVARCGVGETWRKAPVTLETCWSVPYWYERNWDIDFIIEQGLKYHPSVFMPKSCYYPDAWREKLDAFDRKLGYRFVLRQMNLPLDVLPGRPFEVKGLVDNVGVAPLYRPYRLAYRFVQGPTVVIVESAQDIRTWMPGLNWFSESLVVPEGLVQGEAQLSVGVIDPVTRRVVVRFAIEETEADGWHPLTWVDVSAR